MDATSGASCSRINYRISTGLPRHAISLVVVVLCALGCSACSRAGLASSPPASSEVTQPPKCSGTELHMAVQDEGVAAGTHYFGVDISSSSAGACALRGFPHVSLLAHGGIAISTADYYSPTLKKRVGERTVMVAAARHASFLLTMGDGSALPRPLPKCPSLTGLTVRLPHSRRERLAFPLRALPLYAYPGEPQGSCDRVELSPLFQGPPERGMCPACFRLPSTHSKPNSSVTNAIRISWPFRRAQPARL